MRVFGFVFFIIIGIFMIIFPSHFAKSMAGGWGQKYTNAQLSFFKRWSIVAGVICIIVGVIGLVGTIF
jgi:uncharacterized membrane protein